MVRVKICGITNAADARAAVEAGADALGFNFDPRSPRYVAPARARAMIRALPPLVSAVGIFTGTRPAPIRRIARQCGLRVVQVHGRMTPSLLAGLRGLTVIAAVPVRSRRDVARAGRLRVDLLHFDTYDPLRAGGTGRRFDWRLLQRARPRGPFMLAGGLNPGNVRRAVRTVRPYGVDVASGVERAPGRKDPRKVRAFIRAAVTA